MTICGIGSTLGVCAADNIKVYIDNVPVSFDVQPQIIGGRTMVPLRAIFEGLGATVSWDGNTQTITAYNENYIVKTSIGNNVMTVNNEEKTIDISPMIIDGRTLVPARFVAEAFGCGVSWDADTASVNITTSSSVASSTSSQNETYSSSTAVYDCYDDSILPTYTSITGVKLKNTYYSSSSDVITYMYDYDYDNLDKYINYLLDNGWEIYSSETDKENYRVTVYMAKGYNLYGITAEIKFGETWIMVAKH